MRKGLAMIAAVLLLAGCASGTTALAEDDFFESVSELDSFAGVSEARYTEMGEAVCGLLESEPSPDGYVQVLAQFKDGGFADDAGAFIQYAVSTYCPDLQDRIPS
jgi:hypothetical protein